MITKLYKLTNFDMLKLTYVDKKNKMDNLLFNNNGQFSSDARLQLR